ncbi:hypothetical protein LA303_11030 [Candidatus Sulfidibacterium hydrothermale]|uniref:hypothetical protein n=1 Tax=Candidatus Sulfidibacterium hydrothermale TaxID=2875962 RepID=UPI001F0A56C5|nr:hypothetical protein [Candidatus Sulfidibacterium hydrothermale]UBM61934.1 hypothetical protein LA303_11030 [Candidatus Sulfidibacterium hydrothermale]
MNNTAIRTIGKYALLLSIFYVLEYIVEYLVGQKLGNSIAIETKSYLFTGKLFFPYLLNIITAFIINSDKNRLGIEGKYSVLLTIFYRPIGIVLFLVYVIEKEIKSQHTTSPMLHTANNCK